MRWNVACFHGSGARECRDHDVLCVAAANDIRWTSGDARAMDRSGRSEAKEESKMITNVALGRARWSRTARLALAPLLAAALLILAAAPAPAAVGGLYPPATGTCFFQGRMVITAP